LELELFRGLVFDPPSNTSQPTSLESANSKFAYILHCFRTSVCPLHRLELAGGLSWADFQNAKDAQGRVGSGTHTDDCTSTMSSLPNPASGFDVFYI
jgi:hypothetical protein